MGLAGNRDRGAALVEMALVLPLLLLLMFGIFSAARAWQVHNVLAHAAREAARYGAVLETFDEGAVQSVAQAEIEAASIDWAKVTPVCTKVGTDPCGTGTVGSPPTEQVVVQLRYPDYRLDFLFFSLTVDLSADAFARYEHA